MEENIHYISPNNTGNRYVTIALNKLKETRVANCFRVLIFYGLLSLLLLTPFIISSELRFGVVKGKEFWVKGCAGLFLLYFISIKLFRRSEAVLRLNTIDLALISFQVYSTGRIFLENQELFYLEVYWMQSTVLLIYGVLRWYFACIDKKGQYFLIFFLFLFLVMVSLGESVIGLLQLVGEQSSHNGYFKVTGSFANPAPLAFLLAISIPVSLAMVFGLDRLPELSANGTVNIYFDEPIRKKGKQLLKVLCGVNLMMATLVLSLLHIRTGWLMALAGSAIVSILLYQKQVVSVIQKIHLLGRLAVVIVLLGAGVGGYYLKKGSADGRLFIYEVTLNKILEKPLTGQGYNSFYANYNRWQGDWFKNHPKEQYGDKVFLAGNVTMAYNTYLETWVNQGLLGLSLFLLPLVMIFSMLIRIRKRLQELTLKNIFIIGLSGILVALLVGAITYTPLEDTVGRLWYVIALAGLSSLLPLKHWEILKWPINQWLWLPVFIAGLMLLVIGTSYQYRLYHARKTWGEDQYWLVTGNYAKAVDYYSPMYPTLKHEQLFIQEYAKALVLNDQPKESIKVLEEGKVYGNDVFAQITLGDSQRALKDYEAAENAYTDAISMQPGMFYPRYLLVNLYREWGKVVKAKDEASRCIKLPVKAPSAAIKEMKTELKTFLNVSHQPIKERRIMTAK